MFIDEMGPLPAEYWSARDIVLRYITGSGRPNGGSLDFVTFDHLQVHPVRGTHPLLSPFLTSTHRFLRLQESVRAAAHHGWRRLQQITRMTPRNLCSSHQEDEWVKLFVAHVGSVREEAEVPLDALFVYGKNGPIRAQQEKLMKKLQDQPGVLLSKSTDFERNMSGKYSPASALNSACINRKHREQHVIPIFKSARYRITSNKHPTYSNGQIAFLGVMPSSKTIEAKLPFPILVAPPGSSYLPGKEDTQDSLIAMGWKEVKMGLCPDRHAIGRSGRLLRTRQYGIQLHVASTFHSTLGKTVSKLASIIDTTGDRDSPHSIWDPAQVVIMMSRTKLPSETIFVTKDKKATAKAIYSVLKKKSVFRDYLSTLLDRLCSGGNHAHPCIIDNSISIFRPRDCSLPRHGTGFAYILVSTVDTNHVYIGSCSDIVQRFHQHNTGYGSDQTAPPSLRPWAVLGYVSGFASIKHHWVSFENSWIALKDNHIADSTCDTTIESIANLALPLISKYNTMHPDDNLNLSYMNCGTFTILQREQADEGNHLHDEAPEEVATRSSFLIDNIGNIETSDDDTSDDDTSLAHQNSISSNESASLNSQIPNNETFCSSDSDL